MNHIVIMGRLTRDPELRRTQDGTPVASFSLAVDRGVAPKDGGERKTDFFDVTAWRNTGEFVSKYFVKGQMCAVVGRIEFEDWTDRDGNKRRSAKVIAQNVYFTESKKSREAALGGYSEAKGDLGGKDDYAEPYSSPVAGSDFSDIEEDDGDLPF
jgi:single-strand DNA-binding protein